MAQGGAHHVLHLRQRRQLAGDKAPTPTHPPPTTPRDEGPHAPTTPFKGGEDLGVRNFLYEISWAGKADDGLDACTKPQSFLVKPKARLAGPMLESLAFFKESQKETKDLKPWVLHFQKHRWASFRFPLEHKGLPMKRPRAWSLEPGRRGHIQGCQRFLALRSGSAAHGGSLHQGLGRQRRRGGRAVLTKVCAPGRAEGLASKHWKPFLWGSTT